jgi:hypothetical protein
MNDIELKALKLLNEVQREHGSPCDLKMDRDFIKNEALCRAIEQHEAFRQEVSDALLIYSPENRNPALGRFIIDADKPDALVDVWGDLFIKGYNLDQFCDALEARGLEIRTKANAHSKTD